ncbi:MAG: pyrimidine utilization protein D [Alphaproteobacteria bacterium]|nr:pyrimidine utilization protein D [Alphaproteobacteria bacterium]
MPHAAGLWYEWDGPEDGEVLILSAGLGGAGAYWAPNLATFAARYRVLLYDHRGTGRSDRALPDHVTVEDMARDVLGLMDALGIGRARFLGHALGGLIGLALAEAAPERVDRLVVFNGWASLDAYTARCFDVRLALLRDSGAAMYLRAQPIFLYPPDWITVASDELDRLAAKQLEEFPGAAAVEKRVAAAREWDARARLPGIAAPTLVLATADDALVPSHCARALAEGLPNATRMLQFCGGHASNIVEPEDFHARVLPWLAGETFPEE